MTAPTAERRAHVRQRFAWEGSNPPIATLGLVPRAAVICDLSAAGIGLRTTIPPPVGAIVPIWLPGLPGQPSNLVLGTIVHAALESEGLYRVGIACCEESADVLRAVLEQLPALGWSTTESPGNQVD